MSMNSGRMMYMSKFCLSAKKGSGATVVVVVQSSHLPSRIKRYHCEKGVTKNLGGRIKVQTLYQLFYYYYFIILLLLYYYIVIYYYSLMVITDFSNGLSLKAINLADLH